MLTDLLSFGEYTLFVWPAFVFTFVMITFLYYKTKKDLTKYEKLFLIEYGKVSPKMAKNLNQETILPGKPVY
tara:strand:- start:649 stop:864 length:216 start_codon:yes stop_codon:yes gene_type:complete